MGILIPEINYLEISVRYGGRGEEVKMKSDRHNGRRKREIIETRG